MTTGITPSFPDLRLGPSGPRVDAIDIPESAFEPIQNVRFLDDESTVTPANGSIRAPFTDVTDFLAEANGDFGAWKLTLPGRAVVPGSWTIPSLTHNPALVFEGVSAGLGTQIDDVTIETQPTLTGGSSFFFDSLTVFELTVEPQQSIVITFNDCFVGLVQLTGGGTVQGTIRAINTSFDDNLQWRDPAGSALVLCDMCTISGLANELSGTFRDCSFEDFSGTSFTSLTLLNCTFGSTGVTLDSLAPGNQLVIDGVTWRNIGISGVTITGSPDILILDAPEVADFNVPIGILASLAFAAVTVNVGPGLISVAAQDFMSVMPGEYPGSGSPIIVSVVWVDATHVEFGIRNCSGTPTTADNLPIRVALFRQP
jgi:hypothetical protein